jgi:hypothetical protein
VTQILTPIFHALSGREGEVGQPESGVEFDPLAAPLPADDAHTAGPQAPEPRRPDEVGFAQQSSARQDSEQQSSAQQGSEQQGSEQQGSARPTERRGPLQVVAGRTARGAHRARTAAAPAGCYANRAGLHSKPAQPAADPSSQPTGTGAHRAPEDGGSGTGGFVVRGAPVTSEEVGDSGSRHAVSRTGGRHRTLRAVTHQWAGPNKI